MSWTPAVGCNKDGRWGWCIQYDSSYNAITVLVRATTIPTDAYIKLETGWARHPSSHQPPHTWYDSLFSVPQVCAGEHDSLLYVLKVGLRHPLLLPLFNRIHKIPIKCSKFNRRTQLGEWRSNFPCWSMAYGQMFVFLKRLNWGFTVAMQSLSAQFSSPRCHLSSMAAVIGQGHIGWPWSEVNFH